MPAKAKTKRVSPVSGIEYASWWPPNPGDKVQRLEFRQTAKGGVRRAWKTAEVVAVFEHNGESLATIAEWKIGDKKRWSYITIKGWLEARSGYRPATKS